MRLFCFRWPQNNVIFDAIVIINFLSTVHGILYSWSQLSASGISSRNAHVSSFYSNTIYTIAGSDKSNKDLSDVLAFSLTTNTWSPISTSGSPFPARSYAASSIDPSNGAIYVMGGAIYSSGTVAMYNDVWTYSISLSSWSLVTVTGTLPGIRWGHTMNFYSGMSIHSAIHAFIIPIFLIFHTNL